MGWRFRRSIKAGPFRINLSKSGVGVSAGVKGFRVGTGPRGTRATASIPGTGISYVQQIGKGAHTMSGKQSSNNSVGVAPVKKSTSPLLITILVIVGLCLCGAIGSAALPKSSPGPVSTAGITSTSKTSNSSLEPIQLTQNAKAVATVILTIKATDTPTPLKPTEAPTQNAPVVVLDAGAATINIRSGPGTGYAAIDTLSAGQAATIIGRNTDSSWWQIAYDGKAGWVNASVAPAIGDLTQIALAAFSPLTANAEATTSLLASTPTAQAAVAPVATLPAATVAPTQPVVVPTPVPLPTAIPTQPPAACFPVRVGANCSDGTTSTATGSGACSHHGGVASWRMSKCP